MDNRDGGELDSGGGTSEPAVSAEPEMIINQAATKV